MVKVKVKTEEQSIKFSEEDMKNCYVKGFIDGADEGQGKTQIEPNLSFTLFMQQFKQKLGKAGEEKEYDDSDDYNGSGEPQI